MKRLIKALVGVVCLTAFAFASEGDICDSTKVNSMLKRALDNGAVIVKAEKSAQIDGYCEVALQFKGNFEILYINTAKNHFLASTVLVTYDDALKDYQPNRKLLDSLVAEQEEKKNIKVITYLKDKKNLDEYFTFAKSDKSLVKTRKYDVLLFESKTCGYCDELKQKLNNKYKTDDVGIYRIELPLSMNDYNDLKDNYYKSKVKLDKAIELKDKLYDGVPLVLVRDAVTKEYIEIFRSPNAMNFNKFVSYLEAKK